MKVMVLEQQGGSLQCQERPIPTPGKGRVLLKVEACAVCRTDLHLLDGELPDIRYPIVPGHEIIGRVVKCGPDVVLEKGVRLGVPWLGYSCGECRYCLHGKENLCDQARFTGYQIDGGFAEYTLADHRFCFSISSHYSAAEAAPLMCAGLIGYRSLVMCGDDLQRLGIYGFGAAAHIVAQVAKWQGMEVYAFTRPGDEASQRFAQHLGATWVGSSEQLPEAPLDAAIIFAPVGELVPLALRAVRKGGVVVCGGIHMSDIPSFPYALLWGERQLRSVANLTRQDGRAFLSLASQATIQTSTTCYPLHAANDALKDLREGKLTGAAVLVMETPPASEMFDVDS
ncbi:MULTISPECIES: zinc-dependent alcohol dehydrogenase family protein [Halomonadaceae]|uniref:alcohol dehydrogenase n=2 Tax=Vreelandella TaxID=3137766 RepID=A0A7Z0S0A3_9GAMM|nr:MULTISPECIES: zinc-dependent alcohol dehydrogenase family protein [Halomonas]NYS80174.1 zinc-dependent alcohol dehydrogenase family protein [Halomonas glaciei]|tara:strand:+ start:985 stop:2007 length:1023 start_codon:yes stop_codon:yes gene_type:complete